MNESDLRRIAVLDPLKLIIDNYPADQVEECFAPNHPLHPELGQRSIPFSRELWIEGEDFQEVPEKGFRRLFPGNMARLRYGYVVECTGCDKDENGKIVAVHCNYLPETKSGTPGADSVKVKGNLHWVSAAQSYAAEIRLYDRLFSVPAPGARREGDAPELERNFLDDLNPASKTTITAQLEACLREAQAEQRFQFERHGYFAVDRVASQPGRPVFNRALTLKDSWSKGG
jgi:glutaminyl-tRNA synthetase